MFNATAYFLFRMLSNERNIILLVRYIDMECNIENIVCVHVYQKVKCTSVNDRNIDTR